MRFNNWSRVAKLLFFLSVFTVALNAQVVFQQTANSSVYSFLEEMASLRYIEMNSAVKPYSRKFIATQLDVLDKEYRELLNTRQQRELDFYLSDFGKELHRSKDAFKKRFDVLYYTDSIFLASVNPVLNIDYNLSENIFNRQVGVDIFSYLGKGWGAYFNFKDNYENKKITAPSYLNQRIGGDLRNLRDGGSEFSEMRGGLTYAWNWGHVGLVQEYIQWGNHYNGSTILSGRSPLYPQFVLNVKPTSWIEFNSFHAWLNTDIVDSTRTYTIPSNGRIVFRKKYLSANLFTFTPIRHLALSLGNSTIYSDIDFHPAYLIPFFFHRPIDHTLSANINDAGQNSQLFFDVSSRNINHLHLYGSIFIDELRLSTLFNEEERRDQVSYKIGAKVFNLPTNFNINVEYTLNRPAVYRHYIPVQQYESSNYPLGHYLGENADELFISLSYRPFARFYGQFSYTKARKGNATLLVGGNTATALPFLETLEYDYQEVGLKFRYEWRNDIWASIQLIRSNLITSFSSYAPSWQKGDNTFIWFSGGYGF